MSFAVNDFMAKLDNIGSYVNVIDFLLKLNHQIHCKVVFQHQQ